MLHIIIIQWHEFVLAGVARGTVMSKVINLHQGTIVFQNKDSLKEQR